jgi:hypothetical protein
MKKLIYSIFTMFTVPVFGAGTYMGTSGYQSPQRYYSGGSGYYQPQNIGTSGYQGGNYYQQQQNPYAYSGNQQQTQTVSKKSDSNFYISGGVSRQSAQWNFDMNETGSVLNYSDISWNVFDAKAGYKKGKLVLDGGLSYGVQAGESTMTDDDITAGGMKTVYYDTSDNEYQTYTKVLSIGKTKGGSLFGMNFGVGLADTFGFGKTKMTPSVGYRMFSYTLKTSDNHGLSVANNWCYDMGGGQFYCPSYMIADDGSMTWGGYNPANDPDGDGSDGDGHSYDGYYWWELPSGATMVSNGDTYSFSQSGETHVYDVSWNGPYFALDFDSVINENNALNARIELGFPMYSAKGDQPYREDWEHPTSVEDSAGLFKATHLGLLANWTTMMGKTWGLTFGLTYDYYSVSGADAQTNNNGDYYNGILTQLYNLGNCSAPGVCTPWVDEAQMYSTNQTAAAIKDLYESCGNSWSCSLKDEVNSFYKSMGIRVGLTGKF